MSIRATVILATGLIRKSSEDVAEKINPTLAANSFGALSIISPFRWKVFVIFFANHATGLMVNVVNALI